MEQISVVNKFIDYILNNRLTVDKGTYFAVIIGQIAIYGILLTFYQFVASSKGHTRYLGIDTVEFYVKSKISILNRFISTFPFLVLILLEIAYKPFISVYGELFCELVIRFLNFIWYLFAILYFEIFIILFFRFKESVLYLNYYSYPENSYELTKKVNALFIKKSKYKKKHLRPVDLLMHELDRLRFVIERDKDSTLKYGYNTLIEDIFEDYIKKKEKDILKSEKTRKLVKNHIPWRYDEELELHLFQGILKGRYFHLDDDLLSIVFEAHFEILQLNFKIAKLDDCDDLSFDSLSFYFNDNIYNVSGWKELTIDLILKTADGIKPSIIRFLQVDPKYDCYVFIKKYCNECIIAVIKKEVRNVFINERKQGDFVGIYGILTTRELVRSIIIQEIRDLIIAYNKINIELIIELLSPADCAYLFFYLVLFYSIYKSEFEWKYINLDNLKCLWNRQKGERYVIERLIAQIGTTNIAHCFDRKMLLRLQEYINADLDKKLFNDICSDNILDLFYVWTIKVCISNRGNCTKMLYIESFNVDGLILIINGLSAHEELLEDDSVLKWVEYCRNFFSKLDYFPENIKISFNSLLLTDLKEEVVVRHSVEKYYYCVSAIGEYLLLKTKGMVENIDINKIIRNAFVASNMNIEDYVEMIEKRCNTCKYPIDYVQKEKMKGYLRKNLCELPG